MWALAAAMALVAVVVYLRALANGFTNWDDPGYVADNPHLGPLDAQFITWAFTTFRQANWHPLTWLSLGVDHALFGTAPLGYHLSNVLLHGLATLIVVWLVAALFARARGADDGQNLVAAAVVGLIFAIHPLHVESVAWVSERKDVLFGVFYVLAAAQCWRRAADVAPLFSWPLNGLGNLAVQRGALDEARSYYERAIHADPSDAEAQYNFATFLEDQGQIAESRKHYEIFLKVAPPKFSYLFPEVREKLSQLKQL